MNGTHFRLGVAYMRLGETQNCCLRHTPESCILPLRGGAIHTQQEGARKAIDHFTEVLQNSTSDDPLHLASLWLLNIAYMTIGSYPDEIPKPYLIPPKAFESEEDIPRFENIAPRLGLDTFDMSGGAIADDFDSDGYLDIVASDMGHPRPAPLFQKQPRRDIFGTHRGGRIAGFVRRTEPRGRQTTTTTAILTSLCYAVHGSQRAGDIRIPCCVTTAMARSRMSPLTPGWATCITPPRQPPGAITTTTVTSTCISGTKPPGRLKAPCQLFRNNGDGTFTDVAEKVSVQNFGYTKAVIWGDYDNDRWPDLYVSNLAESNRLYHNNGDHNNGDGTFTNIARKLRIANPTRSFPAWFWDFNNDGILDLYVSAYTAGIADLAANLRDMQVKSHLLARLYRGTGEGGFEDVAKQHNLLRPNAPMGSNFGDLDNDGYLDFYLGTGYPDFKNIMPGVMYRNRAGTGFADVSYAGGFAHIQKGHGVVFADFDNDGDADIFEQMGGSFPGDQYSNVLYENPGFGNHWLTVKLVGVRSNRSAIGARIHVKVIENGVSRSIYKHVNSGGSFGANPLRQTIGLGTASKIEVLEIFWPTTNLTQTFDDVPMDSVIQLVEGEPEYTPLTVKN